MQATPNRPDLSYFGTVPETFVQLADVHLVVEGCSFPAHSQFMAAHSNVMQQLLTEAQHNFSAAAPLRMEAEMARYTKPDVTAFLTHVYQQLPPSSEVEAWGLYQLADQFEAPGLMQRAIGVIEEGGSILKASTEDDGAVHYLQMAERLQLKAFRRRCLQFIADNFESVQQDARIGQLQAATLVELLRTVQGHLTAKLEPRELEQSPQSGVGLQFWCNNACPGHTLQWHKSRSPDLCYGSRPLCGKARQPKWFTAPRPQSRIALLKYIEDACSCS